jgi:hypothetical protein
MTMFVAMSRLDRLVTGKRRGPGVAAVAVAAIWLLASGPCSQPAAAQFSPAGRAVLSDTDAYLILPPELIAGPVVEHATVSPLKRNVAVLRVTARVGAENLPSAANQNPPRPREERELVFWNAGLRKPVSLWQSAQPGLRVALSEWMPGTESVLALLDQEGPGDPQRPTDGPTHEWKLLLLGLGIERAVVVPLPVGRYAEVDMQVSPEQPLAVVRMVSYDPVRASFLLVHRNGRVGARIDPPEGVLDVLQWDLAGNPLLAAVQQDGANVRRTYYAVDVRTGQTQLLAKAPQRHAGAVVETPRLPFHVVTRRQNVTLAESVERIRPIWLESSVKSEYPRVLLAADGADVTLLPDADGALYNSRAAFWFTPILKMDRTTYVTVRHAAERAVAVSNAKQLGLAARMYAADYDEVLPGPDGIQDKLSPYLGSDSLFEGFTYTFGGSALADIESPSQTVLGFVIGPGGRAVVYADGHARWAND